MARAARIALDMALEASKSLKSASSMSWQYLKTEAVPPMTLSFFHGPGGKKLEDMVSRATDNFIAGIENQIKQMELEKLREIQRREAEAKFLQEKIKAEAKRKSEEAKKQAAKKFAEKDKAKVKAKVASAEPEAKPKQAAAEIKPKQAAADTKPKQTASATKPKQTAPGTKTKQTPHKKEK